MATDTDRAREYNRYQERPMVDLDPETLEALLLEAELRADGDADAIRSALHCASLELEVPTTRLVVQHLNTPDRGWIPGANAWIDYAIVRGESQPRVSVMIANDTLSRGEPSTLWNRAADAFGIPHELVVHSGSGEATYLISEWLGCDAHSVRAR